MTTLTKPLTRRSNETIRDQGRLRRLVVTLYPNGTIGVRGEKTRREEIVTIEAVYSLAVKQRVAKERAEKKALKKARSR